MEDEIFENAKSKARDLLMCSLCSNTYVDPRRLPCDHSFCRRCLQAYHDSISNNGSVRLGSFVCPACNALIGIPRGGVSFFPVDKRIGDIKEKVVDEMQDILRRKLLAGKGMSDTGSSFESKETESQNSDSFRQRGKGSHETDPPTHEGKSRSFGRHQIFTAFDARQKNSETSNASSSRPRFDRQRPMYSSLRETHRRKAQDLLAAFSQTDEFLPGSSSSRETYNNASETSYPTNRKSFNSSSRFKTHHSEDVPQRFSSGNSRSSFDSSESAKTSSDSAGSFSNVSSASGYFDDRNSSFLRNHRGYESLREKSSRRTYLGEETFSSNFAGKTAGESKFQETKRNFEDLYGRYKEENDTRSVPVVERDSPLATAAGLKTASEHKPESVSDPSFMNHAGKDRVHLNDLGDVKTNHFERPAETVAHASDDSVNGQNGEVPELTSQPPFRRKENFAGFRKSSSGRTKLLGSFISPLATAHEECALGGKTSSEESAPSEGTRNKLRCPPDFTNISTSNTSAPADLISNSSRDKSVVNEKQTLGEAVDKRTKFSGKAPLKNLNNSSSLDEEVEAMQEFDLVLEQLNEEEEEVEAMQEFDFLLEEVDEEEENGLDDTTGSDSSASINCTINKTSLPEQHPEHRGESSHRGNGVTVESSNGMEEGLSRCPDLLPPTVRFGNDEKVKDVASGENISSLHREDNMTIHDDSKLIDAAGDDDDDDDDDTLVNGKASEEEDNCFDQSPPVSSSVTGDSFKTAGQTTRAMPRLKRQKRTVNEGTATLHHVSPEVYLMPTGVAILSQGSTVVADYGIGCLQYYADDGSPLHRIEGMKPFSIAVNLANNQVIVGDRRRKTVCLFDESGSDVAQWNDNMFKWICGIGILSSGDLVILDREKSQIGIYKPNGKRQHTFGSYGNEDSQLCMAEFLVVDGMDRIVVSDSGNHCIKVFSIDGALLLKFGSRGCNDGEMQWPKGICTDESNNIIVADTCNSRVSMFSSDGSFVQHLVTNITMPYAVSYSNPNVAVTRYSVMGQSQFLLYSISNKS